jgi:predicted  nucleic acid-binding Zn-ribbon protein
MHPQSKRNSVLALVILALVVVACNMGNETDTANKLVDEGNKLVEEGNKLAKESGAKNDQVYDEINIATFADDKSKYTARAKEAAEGMGKAADKFREASKKFDEASKLKVDEKFKEYLALKSQEFAKNAEQMEAAKEMPQAILDSEDSQTLQSKVSGTKPRHDKLSKEAKDLADKAEKIRTENKDKFKS